MTNLAKAKLLKKEILSQYKSVRQFAIEGMAYGTVIRICDKLNLNPVTLKPLAESSLSEQLMENRVMSYYVKLNQEGKDKILDLMEDFASIKKYRAK